MGKSVAEAAEESGFEATATSVQKGWVSHPFLATLVWLTAAVSLGWCLGVLL